MGRNDPHDHLFAFYHSALTRLTQGEDLDGPLRQFELRLLLGTAMPSTWAGTGTRPGVDPTKGRYIYERESGFVQGEGEEGSRLAGETLLALASDAATVRAHRAGGARPAQAALAPHLGGRPLREPTGRCFRQWPLTVGTDSISGPRSIGPGNCEEPLMSSFNPPEVLLGVNIDHIATLRQARGTRYPEPIQAALVAEQAGRIGITLHLREDRRHIQDRDVEMLAGSLQTRMNLEMAATPEMLAVAAGSGQPNAASCRATGGADHRGRSGRGGPVVMSPDLSAPASSGRGARVAVHRRRPASGRGSS